MNDGGLHAAGERNRLVWDGMVRQRQAFTLPARDEDFADPIRALDTHGWLGTSVAGQRVLCLASGGGRQSALFAAAGAEVTVVDLSPAMLALDRQVAAERGLDVRTIEASMDDLSMLPSAGFDLVYQPVSSCYVPELSPVYQEVARLTAPGGLYICQHKQPGSLQAAMTAGPLGGYEVHHAYDQRGPLPPVEGTLVREPGAQEYFHSWESLIGGLCRAGFLIEDLVEPWHGDPTATPGSFRHRARYLPPYVRLKARRIDRGPANSKVWTP